MFIISLNGRPKQTKRVKKVTIKPTVSPKYTKKAILVDCNEIKGLPLSVGEIAQHATPHQNTVSSKMNGQAGVYVSVHQVFTGVSIASDNAFSRADHAYFIDNQSQLQQRDDALDNCLVFHRLGKLLDEIGVSPKEAGNLADVQTHIVKAMVKGLPVAKNCVDAVFNALKEKTELRRSEWLFK